jgi:diaminopimelate decarboxylase
MPIDINLNENQIKELIEKYGSPLQIYDGNKIIYNYKNFITSMLKKLNVFKQFFAVKALPNPHILKLLVNNGSNLDCSSLSELKIAESIGITGDKIMFTSNYTSIDDLLYAKKLNATINLDDISLIEDLNKIGIPKTLFLRLNPNIGKTDSETKSNILGGSNAKFGIADFQIVDAFKLAKKYGVEKFGLHIMTGSNVLNIDYWKELIEIISYYIIKIENECNLKIDYINLGGGIGIPYKLDQKPIVIEEFSELISSNLIKYNLQNKEIYMENGRFITGPYGWLITKCNVIKNTYAKYYGLDACMSNLMRCGMYNAYHHITVLTDNTNIIKANIVGTLCENNDWFAKDREIKEAKVGDIFIIHDTGAHSHSMGFQYNGKLRAPEILLIEDEHKLIRRRETYEDYISTVI